MLIKKLPDLNSKMYPHSYKILAGNIIKLLKYKKDPFNYLNFRNFVSLLKI